GGNLWEVVNAHHCHYGHRPAASFRARRELRYLSSPLENTPHPRPLPGWGEGVRAARPLPERAGWGEGVRAAMPLAEQAERGEGAVFKPLPGRGEAARSAGEGYSRAGRSVFIIVLTPRVGSSQALGARLGCGTMRISAAPSTGSVEVRAITTGKP